RERPRAPPGARSPPRPRGGDSSSAGRRRRAPPLRPRAPPPPGSPAARPGTCPVVRRPPRTGRGGSPGGDVERAARWARSTVGGDEPREQDRDSDDDEAVREVEC